jgi:hypothetical protein
MDPKRTELLGWTGLAALTSLALGALAQTSALDVLAGKRLGMPIISRGDKAGMLKVPADGNILCEMVDR